MAKLINCKTCGAQVATSAKRCPHCGAPVTNAGKIAGQIIGGIFFGIFLVSVLLIVLSLDSDRDGSSGTVGDDTNADGAAGTTVPSDVTGAPGSSTASDDEQGITPTENSSFVGINDVLHAQNFDLSVVSASTCAAISNELGIQYTAEEGNTLLYITFKAENTRGETWNAPAPLASVDGQMITQLIVAGKIDGNLPLSGAVSASSHSLGYIIWELPRSWKSFHLSFLDSGTGEEAEQAFEFSFTDIK